MKDIPLFTTQYGIASLILREIPYRQEAYVRIQSSQQIRELVQECIGFCRACGAEKIYATGHGDLVSYPLYTAVLKMQGNRKNLPNTDAMLFPMIPELAEQWRSIYNQRMAGVDNASYMTRKEAQELADKNEAYFVHRDGSLLGIGSACGGRIGALASVVPGSGRDVALALMSVLAEDMAELEVASTNEKALRLYKSFGFVTVSEQTRWYRIFG